MPKEITRLTFHLALVCGLLLAAPGTLAAQNEGDQEEAAATEESPAEESSADGVEAVSETITVTATKREQALHDVPISVTVLPAQALEDFGIEGLVEVENVTPNLRINQAFAGYAPQYAIRGVGDQANTDEVNSSPVAIHVNEVANAFPIATTDHIFDIDQVEVLRGPQGDLFGLNTTGGTINLVTAKPTSQFQASLYTELGRYESAKVDAFVSGPMSETTWGRFAVSTSQRGEGWQQHAITGEKHGEEDRGGARASLRYIKNRLLADVEGHYGWDQSDLQASRLIEPFFDVFGREIQAVSASDQVKWSDGQPFGLEGMGRPGNDNESHGLTANITHTGDKLSFTSVTGIQNFDRASWIDVDGAEVKDGDNVRFTDIESFSQEFRLASVTGETYWVVGTNYAEDTVENFYIFDQPDNLAFPAIGGNNTKQDREMFAVFAHVETPINDQWGVSGGVRFTDESRDIVLDGTKLLEDPLGIFAGIYGPGDILTDSIVSCFVFGDCTPGSPFVASVSDSDFSGKAVLTYAPNPDWNLYWSAARGFKSGGFNDTAASVGEQFVPYGPETLNAFEFGAKGGNSDGSLLWNSALFFYDYEDQQTGDSIVDPFFGALGAIVNVPKSEILGLETEVNWRVSQRTTITQSVGFNKGEWSDFQAIDANAVQAQAADPNFPGLFSPVFVDLSGQDIGFPELQYSGTLAVEQPLSNDKNLRFFLDYNYEDKAQTPGEAIVLPAYWIVNARLSLAVNDRFEIGVWGRNILDEDYLNFQGFFNFGLVEVTGMPATYGISLRINS